MQYRSAGKSVFSVKYHVMWCPKYRRDVLRGPIQTRLKQIIGEVVAGFGGVVIGVETMSDHVHLLVELSPQVAVSKLVQILQGAVVAAASAGVRVSGADEVFVVAVVVRPGGRRSTTGGGQTLCREPESRRCLPRDGGVAVALRYRLYPAAQQSAFMLERHCADGRCVWNLAVEQFNWGRAGRSAPGPVQRQKQLAEARQEFGWLAAGSSSVQQQALRDFDRAVGAFFGGTHRRPTWRRKFHRETATPG